jgi:hypothetical protein
MKSWSTAYLVHFVLVSLLCNLLLEAPAAGQQPSPQPPLPAAETPQPLPLPAAETPQPLPLPAETPQPPNAEPAAETPQSPDAKPAEPSPELTIEPLLESLDTHLEQYVAIAVGVFGVGRESEYDFAAVRAAARALAQDALDDLAEITGTGNAQLTCLTELAENSVLASSLARLTRRRPGVLFIQEYLRSYCRGRMGSAYQKGKIPMRQARVTKLTGDLVVEKKKVWLTSDQGTVGNSNGAVDTGEWFSLQVELVNRSRSTPHLSATATLVLLDERSNRCLPVPEAAPSSHPPRGCRTGVVLSDPIPLPELSPGQHATVGPFQVALNPGLLEAFRFRIGLHVRTSDKDSSLSVIEVRVAAPPHIELSGITIDDDQTGHSVGNSNGRIEPGERVELRTEVTMTGRKQMSKIGVSAHNYTTFLSIADHRVGLPLLKDKKPATLTGDIEFEVPTVDSMAAVPPDRIDQRFFYDRRAAIWLSAAGCDGKLKLSRDWASTVPGRITCPYSAPGYQFVLPLDLYVEFGQLLLITSDPPGATITVNHNLLGNTSELAPLVYGGLKPARNEILYYPVEVDMYGFQSQSIELPVIWKDRTAGNLTEPLHFELKPPAPPEPAVTTPATVPPLPAADKQEEPKADPPPPPRLRVKHPFRLFAGPAYRQLRPVFDETIEDDAWIKGGKPGGMAGFELGASYFFAPSFFLRLTGQLYFSLKDPDPAVSFYASPRKPAPPEDVLPVSAASLTGWAVALEPGFRLKAWRFLFNLGMGLQLDGLIGEVLQDSNSPDKDGKRATIQPEPISVAARVSAGLAIETNARVLPYVSSFLLLPPNGGIDWAVSGGLEFRL